MQAIDSLEVSRRTPDFEDFIDIARRHRSWILGPIWAGIVISVVVAFLWPDTYVSTAMVRITSSQVPERLVATNMNRVLSERISAILEGVLSRSTLGTIIQTHDLYPREKRRLPMDDVIEQMRKDIRTGTVALQQNQSRVGAFPISFAYENRFLAQKVTADIVNRLIDQNERETLQISQQTTDFFVVEVDKAKARLDEIEKQLTAFRLQNAGSLSEDLHMNVSAMNSLDQRLSQVNASISRVTQDRLLIEGDIRIKKEQLAKSIEAAQALNDPVRAQAKNEELARKDREIQQAENLLAQYKEMWTPKHPDVLRMETNLSLLKRQRDSLQKADEADRKAAAELEAKQVKTPTKKVEMTGEMIALDTGIKQGESLIEAKKLELQELHTDLTRLNNQVKNYQARITASPLSAQTYAQLNRDYEQAKATYTNMKAKSEESARGTAIVRNKQGETLDLLDQASLPQTATEPRRGRIVGFGAGLGFLLSLVVVGIREMKDSTLKNLKDVRAYTQLAVLGCVPLLEDDIIVKRRKRNALLGWLTTIILGILVMGGAVAYYMVTQA